MWGAMLVLCTGLLRAARPDVDDAQASLALLLVVLGGSLAGGRPLGFVLALLSTAIIDGFFQVPYGFVTVPKPLDFVVLMSFLATAFVTTELLTRSRQEASAAQARTSEVETLSRLGAESLRHASSEEALGAMATLVRGAIGAESCAIMTRDSPRGAEGMAFASTGQSRPIGEETTERRAIEGAMDARRPVLLDTGGHWTEHTGADIGQPGDLVMRPKLLVLPLLAKDRVIGVLVVRGHDALELDAPRRRLLAALSYYATLGLERMRLMTEAAYSEALREAQRAKDEVFASVSHDLRTPLTTIKVLAQSGADRGERTSLAIVEQADRLARLVSDLLEMSRFRAGGFTLVPEFNTIEDLVGAALRQAEGVRAGRDIDVHIDFDQPALVGHFDFVHTLRIVGNLLDNALRHTPERGRIEVSALRDGAWLVLSVADRGAGVPPMEQERIFEPFYRPADATPDGGHAGLGLSIARSLAEVQGGTVSYGEREGGGSIFELRLPVADVGDLGGLDGG